MYAQHRLKAFLSLALLITYVSRVPGANNPVADERAVVTAGKARFTLLTERLIRMEWGQAVDTATFTVLNRLLPVPKFDKSMIGDWLVLSTDSLQLRYLTTAESTFSDKSLQVTLNVSGKAATWKPEPTWNATLNGNLLGTARTLDGNRGASNMDLNCLTNPRPDLHCTLGLVSRSGYVVVDDTGRPQFDNNTEWPWLAATAVQPPPADQCSISGELRRDCGYTGISQLDCEGKGCCYDSSLAKMRDRGEADHITQGVPSCFFATEAKQDLYFFGHGHDYRGALYDFTLIAGSVPLPPRYAFGILYSRYWAYSDVEEMEVVREYERHGLPLDVLVTDMDWHITFYNGKHDQAGEQMGWTGFTWDKHLFPGPSSFLQWCKARGLKNTLNLHPASGIQPWEEKYNEMAKAMGIDPSTEKYVPFEPVNKTFVTNWNRIVLGEREQEGIDYWWLDWQQGEDWIKVPGVNPTFWLNYIFFTNPDHWSRGGVQRRGMLMHRWGGLGNHRYQIGFSGDVVPLWESLDFQVYFTITASNVAYGFWSHDLGGHITPSPPELYTRWIQWGTFSPIFRTHCTKNANNYRRIWLYPFYFYSIMRRYLQLRAALVPYLYTAARQAHDTGVSMLRPMYYDYSEDEEAYTYDHQYMLGDSLLVAPITQALTPEYNTSQKAIWLPKGTFVSIQGGEVYHGPVVVTKNYTLEEMPVFSVAGAVVPLRANSDLVGGSAQLLPSTLCLFVFVAGGYGTAGTGMVYEDDGYTVKYEEDEWSKTHFTYSQATSDHIQLTIGNVQGTFTGAPTEREYVVSFISVWPAATVQINGKELKYALFDTPCVEPDGCWSYDGSNLAVVVYLTTPLSTSQTHTVDVTLTSKLPSPLLASNFSGRVLRFQKAKQLLDDQWGTGDTVHQQDYPSILLAGEAGMRLTYNPSSQQALTELQTFEETVKKARDEVLALRIGDNLRSVVLELLS